MEEECPIAPLAWPKALMSLDLNETLRHSRNQTWRGSAPNAEESRAEQKKGKGCETTRRWKWARQKQWARTQQDKPPPTPQPFFKAVLGTTCTYRLSERLWKQPARCKEPSEFPQSRSHKWRCAVTMCRLQGYTGINGSSVDSSRLLRRFFPLYFFHLFHHLVTC